MDADVAQRMPHRRIVLVHEDHDASISVTRFRSAFRGKFRYRLAEVLMRGP